MLLWHCDICRRKTTAYPMQQILVWPDRMHEGNRTKMPTYRGDICCWCAAKLMQHLNKRGTGKTAKGKQRCVICKESAHGLIRILPGGAQSWYHYTHTGNLCDFHMAPFSTNVTRRLKSYQRTYQLRRMELDYIAQLPD